MTCSLSLCKNTSFLKSTANVMGKILVQLCFEYSSMNPPLTVIKMVHVYRA